MKKRLPGKDADSVTAVPVGIDECVVGKGSRFQGDFSCAGLLRIEGECVGKISVSGFLVIARGAIVNAEIEADEVIVAGKVKGKITAWRSVYLEATAQVKADIHARKFKLDDGALFAGAVSGLPERIDSSIPQY